MPLDILRLFSTLTAVIGLIAVFELEAFVSGPPVPLKMRSINQASKLQFTTEKGVRYAPPETVGPLGAMEPVGQGVWNRSESGVGTEKGVDGGCGVWKEKGRGARV
ncbi:hypothetical protein EV426DRAFT_678003 [Tirmania nivea]|nr:hypothetical protein EV426DRAFT_678003 [Tirmania nivea]